MDNKNLTDTYKDSRLSWTEIIGGIIVSPISTLEYMKNNPSWVLPFLLLGLGGLISGLSFMKTIFSGYKGSIPVFMIIGFISGMVGIIISGWISWLIQTWIVHLLIRIFKERGNYNKLFCLFGYSHLPYFFRSIFLSIIIILNPGFYKIAGRFFGLAYFLKDISNDSLVYVFFSNMEVFTIWCLILSTLSLKILYNFSNKKSILIIVIYWLVIISFQIFMIWIGNIFMAAKSTEWIPIKTL